MSLGQDWIDEHEESVLRNPGRVTYTVTHIMWRGEWYPSPHPRGFDIEDFKSIDIELNNSLPGELNWDGTLIPVSAIEAIRYKVRGESA